MRFGLSRYFNCFFSTWRSIFTSTATVLACCRDADEKKNVSRLALFCSLGLIIFLLTALPDIAFGNQSGRTERHVPPVFQIPAEGLVTIAPEYLEFLEGVDHTASFDSLEQADWGKNLINDQSLVDGYWVRFRVANTLASEDIGIEHNFNTEKKIFAAHSRGVDEYPYWKQREGDWIDEGRVLGHYRVLMPAGEITTVYDYFRNKPFDRYMSKVNGLDRMTIGPWKDIRSLQLLGLAANIAVLAIALSFGLYYFFMFTVSRGNYLWLAASLFQIAFCSATTLSLGWVMQLPGWLVNSEFTLASLSLLFLFLVRFFRNSLNLGANFPRIDRIFLLASIFYGLMVALNLYLTLSWPQQANLDLVAHPPDRAGPGIIKVDAIMLPFILLLLSSAIMSFIQWRRGSLYAKYLLVSFALPFLAVPISGLTYFIFDFSWAFWFVVSSAVGILFLAMFVTFGFAVAQQLNDTKALALARQVELTKAYQRFVPPQLLSNLNKESILDVQLGDQVNVEMSILFSDIRSFTSISERLSPEENFSFVNAYLSRMGPIIRHHKGYIDKFMGDGVMALFPNHPGDAVSSAIAMQQELHSYNATARDTGLHEINIGIGLNTGDMMLGTLGEANRMEGSVISDAVNLASRLEGLTKIYGAGILVSDVTHDASAGEFVSRRVDIVAVKGKEKPVGIYEIIDGEPDTSRLLKEKTLVSFSDGVSYYQTQNFEKAADCFKTVLGTNADDLTADLYLARCQTLLREGWDQASWDGIERLQIK
jgi:class 3 adenylate cyclase|tara:strand:- start:3686 stop:5974 length:2289 start_codon:yes stop_codon:yes gene_type:complete